MADPKGLVRLTFHMQEPDMADIKKTTSFISDHVKKEFQKAGIDSIEINNVNIDEQLIERQLSSIVDLVEKKFDGLNLNNVFQNFVGEGLNLQDQLQLMLQFENVLNEISSKSFRNLEDLKSLSAEDMSKVLSEVVKVQKFLNAQKIGGKGKGIKLSDNIGRLFLNSLSKGILNGNSVDDVLKEFEKNKRLDRDTGGRATIEELYGARAYSQKNIKQLAKILDVGDFGNEYFDKMSNASTKQSATRAYNQFLAYAARYEQLVGESALTEQNILDLADETGYSPEAIKEHLESVKNQMTITFETVKDFNAKISEEQAKGNAKLKEVKNIQDSKAATSGKAKVEAQQLDAKEVEEATKKAQEEFDAKQQKIEIAPIIDKEETSKNLKEQIQEAVDTGDPLKVPTEIQPIISNEEINQTLTEVERNGEKIYKLHKLSKRVKDYKVEQITENDGISDLGTLPYSDIKTLLKGYKYDSNLGMYFSKSGKNGYHIEAEIKEGKELLAVQEELRRSRKKTAEESKETSQTNIDTSQSLDSISNIKIDAEQLKKDLAKLFEKGITVKYVTDKTSINKAKAEAEKFKAEIEKQLSEIKIEPKEIDLSNTKIENNNLNNPPVPPNNGGGGNIPPGGDSGGGNPPNSSNNNETKSSYNDPNNTAFRKQINNLQTLISLKEKLGKFKFIDYEDLSLNQKLDYSKLSEWEAQTLDSYNHIKDLLAEGEIEFTDKQNQIIDQWEQKLTDTVDRVDDVLVTHTFTEEVQSMRKEIDDLLNSGVITEDIANELNDLDKSLSLVSSTEELKQYKQELIEIRSEVNSLKEAEDKLNQTRANIQKSVGKQISSGNFTDDILYDKASQILDKYNGVDSENITGLKNILSQRDNINLAEEIKSLYNQGLKNLNKEQLDDLQKLIDQYEYLERTILNYENVITRTDSKENALLNSIREQEKKAKEIESSIGEKIASNKIDDTNVNADVLLKKYEDTGIKETSQDLQTLEDKAKDLSGIVSDLKAKFNKDGTLVNPKDTVEVEELIKKYNELLVIVTSLYDKINSSSSNESQALSAYQKEQKNMQNIINRVTEQYSNNKLTSQLTSMQSSLGKYAGQDSESLTLATNYFKSYENAYKNYIASLKENATEEEKILGQSKENLEILLNGYTTFTNQMKIVKSELSESVDPDDHSGSQKMLNWLDNNTKAVAKYGDQVRELAKQWEEAKTQIERANIEKKFKDIRDSAKEANLTGDNFGRGLLNTFSKIAQFTGIYRVINRFAYQLPHQAWSAIQDINKAQIELQKVTTATGNELAEYYDKANESAQKYGATLTDVISTTADWQRLGYNLPDSTYLSDMTILMQKIGDNMTQESSSQGMISTLQGFRMQADEAGRIVDVINEVANTSPIDTAGLFTALEKSASSLSAAGNSFEESVALITGANSILQNPNIVGNGLKTMTMRIRGAKTELEEAGEDVEGMAETTASLRSTLIALSGVDIMIDENTFKSTYQILDELSQKWQDLTDIQQAAITEKIAGKRQGNLMAGIMKNFDTVRKAYNTGMYEAEGSAERELANWNKGIEASLSHLKAQFESFVMAIGKTGVIKGVIDSLTSILKLLTDITEATSGIGTILTGIGVLGFFKNFEGLVSKGAKLAEVASGAAEVAEGMEAVSAAGAAVGEGAGVATGAISKLGLAFSGLGSAIISPMGIAAIAITTITIALSKLYASYKQHQQELISQANAAKDSWNETNSSLENYSKQYETLSKKLSTLSVTDPEYVSTKQQLYDLQDSVISQFGKEANGISLVNGNYEQQLDLLKNIRAEKAKVLLQDNKESYNKTIKDIENPEAPLALSALSNKDFDVTPLFSGNVYERKDYLDKYINDLNKELEKADYKEKVRIEKSIKVAKEYKEKYQEIIDNEGDAYTTILQQILDASGNGDILSNYQNAITQLNNALKVGNETSIEEAIIKYQDAKTAVEELDAAHLQYGDTVQDVSELFEDSAKYLNEVNLTQYQFTKELKKSGSQLKNWASVLKDVDKADLLEYLKSGGLTNDFSARGRSLKQLANLSGFNVTELGKGGAETNAFVNALIDAGYVIGDYSDNVRNAKKAYDEFSESTKSALENVSNVSNMLNNSLAGKFSADDARTFRDQTKLIGSFTAKNAKMFDNLFGDQAQKALERTANGYHLNRKALAELTEQQKMAQRMNYLESLEDAYNELSRIEDQIKNSKPGEDITALQNSRKEVLNYIQSIKDLQLEYEAATSKYQAWVSAVSSANEDDMYNSIRDSYDKMKEIADLGKFGNDDLKAYVDLLTFKDMSQASPKEIMNAWDNLDKKIKGSTYSVKDFLKEGNDGAINYVEAINQINKAWAYQDKNGNWVLDFDNAELAKAMGVSQEFIDIMDRTLLEYGFDMKLNSQPAFDTIDEIKEGLKGLQKYLKDTGIEFKPTLSGTELDEEIEKVKEVRDKYSNIDNKSNEELKSLNALNLALEYYIKMKFEANQEQLETKDISDADQKVQEAAEYLNAYRQAKQDVEMTKLMSGDDKDSLAEVNKQLENAKNNLQYIGLNEGKELAMSLGLNVDGKATAKDVQQQLADEMDKNPVKFFTVLDDNAFKQQVDAMAQGIQRGLSNISLEINDGDKNFVVRFLSDTSGVEEGVNEVVEDLKTIPQEEKVDIKTNEAELKQKTEEAINELKTIPSKEIVDLKANNYITTEVEKAKKSLNSLKDKKINITTTKSVVYDGKGLNQVTGTAYAKGSWGTKNGGTALGGELGQELVVRKGQFFTVGDDGAEFFDYQKGDIIFNAAQTASLFKYGGLKGANSRGKALAFGTAFDSGSGAFLRQRTSTATTTKSTVSNKSKNASKKKSTSSKKNAFSELLDEIEIRIQNLEEEIQSLASVADNAFERFSTRNNAIIDQLETIQKEIRANQLGYTRYMEEANAVGLSEKWAKLVREGAIDIDQITDEKLWKKIEEYKKWVDLADQCLVKVDELKVSEAELYKQRFDLVQTMYESVIDEIQHSIDVMDAFVELTEAQGHMVSGQYYDKMIQAENKILTELEHERDALIASLNDAVASGRIKTYSEEWFNMNQTIDELCNSIIEAKKNIVEYKNEIRQLRFDAFDALQETISDINDEVEFLYNLLDENKMFDDKGKATDEGLAAFGLTATSFDTYMQLANNYANEIKKIQEELANDPNNQTLIDRQKELTQAQRGAIENAKKQREAIVSLVEKGIKKEIDALKETIDQYEKLLDTQKDESDYAKSIAEQQANIDKLRKRLRVAENDNSEEGAANRQKLRNELKEAEKSLEEKQQDRQLAQTKELLSELQTQYEDLLNGRLDNIDQLITDVISEVNSGVSQISEVINTVAQDVGYTLSDSMLTILDVNSALNESLSGTLASTDETIKAMVSDFHDGNFINNVTSINDAIQKLVGISEAQQELAEQEAAKNIAEENARHEEQTTAMNQAIEEASKGHWRTDDNGTYYERPDGSSPTGVFEKIDDDTYYFGEDSYLKTGWQKKDNKWYYMDSEGKRQTGWITDEKGKKYYLDESTGERYNGLQKINDKLYYFDSSTGETKTGLQTVNKKKYFFNGETGESQTGWQTINKKTYYFDPETSQAKTGWLTLDGKKYYFGTDGIMKTGWQKINKKWYYFVKATGEMRQGGTFKIGGVNYKFNNNGVLTSHKKPKGYASGTKRVPDMGIYNLDEEGTEFKLSDGSTLKKLYTGDMVFNRGATQNLWEAANNPAQFISKYIPNLNAIKRDTSSGGNNVNIQFNLSGLKNPEEFMSALQKNKKFEKLIQELSIGRLNGHGALQKYSI